MRRPGPKEGRGISARPPGAVRLRDVVQREGNTRACPRNLFACACCTSLEKATPPHPQAVKGDVSMTWGEGRRSRGTAVPSAGGTTGVPTAPCSWFQQPLPAGQQTHPNMDEMTDVGYIS